MHTANVVTAWATATTDRMREGIAHAGSDPRELAALTLVATHDGCSLDWLRHRISLTQSGTVRLVDRISSKGRIRRGASTGRGVPLHITETGQRYLREWQEVQARIVDELLAGLTLDQRRVLVEGMATALAAHGRARHQADAICRTCSWAACEPDCPVDRSAVAAETAQ
jgi:DNA-binding MarR family transcriptional regulator